MRDHEPTLAEMDAAQRGLDESLRALRKMVRDGSAEDRQWALRLLLQTRERSRGLLPRALSVMLDAALLAPEEFPPSMTEEDRQECRDMLVGNGLLTAGELETFPRASLYAIVQQRFRRWEETGEARG